MISDIVAEYLTIFPDDEPKLELLLNQLADAEALDDPSNYRGHIAGDAVIFSPDHKKILLIYHKTFKKWQQPGGHLDPGEEGPWLTAEREAAEETGLIDLKRVNMTADWRVPLHITTGPVPANPQKGRPDHWHHDFRYGFVARSEELPDVQDEGVSGVKWLPLDEFDGHGLGAHDLATSIKRFKRLLGLKA